MIPGPEQCPAVDPLADRRGVPEPRPFGPLEWDTLSRYIEEEFGEGFANNDFVFRGETATGRPVLPVLDRLLPQGSCVGGVAGRLEAEARAMLRFRQSAPMHLDLIQWQLLGSGFEAQTVMRHYGAPTRLLDWTGSPWIALFFACEDASLPPKAEAHPGRLLAFDRKILENYVRGHHSDESPAHAQAVTGPWGMEIPRLLDPAFEADAHPWVVCYHHHREKFPRLSAQQGLFTMASKPWLDHWDTIKQLCPTSYREVTVDPGLKPTAMRRLARMGITAATLFPGVEGVAREVGAHERLYLGGQ